MKKLIIAVVGLIFGYGLAWSGLVQPEIVLSFLLLQDLGIVITFFSAVVIVAFFSRVFPAVMNKPVYGVAFKKYRNVITGRTVVGAVLFGIGWGLTGLGPGAAFASIGVGNWPALIGLAGMLLGAYAYGVVYNGKAPRADA